MADISFESLNGFSDDLQVLCPYCGASFSTVADCSGGAAEYVEDCRVCCQPIVFRLFVDGDGALDEVRFMRENE